MSYLAKSLWYIESHYAASLSLEEIAQVDGASRYHLTRAFGLVTDTCLPESGYTAADTPHFERYGQQFDPASGMGGVEIWLPLKA